MNAKLLESLENSCKQLPKLFPLNAPTAMIISEIQIVCNLTFTLIHESLVAETRLKIKEMRDKKQA